jgi:hypothetical protein
LLLMGDQLEKPFSDVANPFPLRWPEALGFLRLPAWLAVFASLFIGAAAATSRYKRSQGIERLQMLWLAYAALLIPLGMISFLAWGLVFGEAGDAVLGLLLGMEAAVAIAVGVAVTRYRLYEIDRLINRTLVYTLVTVSLGELGNGPRRPRGRGCLRTTAESRAGCGGLALRPPPLRRAATRARLCRRRARGAARARGRCRCACLGASRPEC